MNKLLNTSHFGDCLEIMKIIPDKSIDLILADLPQGITKNKWDVIIDFNLLWEQYLRIAKENCAIILFANQPFTTELINSNKKIFRYSLVWQKTNPTGFFNAKKMPLRTHEDICVFYKKLPVYNPIKTTGHARKVSSAHHKRNSIQSENYGKSKPTSYDSTERYPNSVLKFSLDKQKRKGHGTIKPLALLEYLINTYSNQGGVVLDNCAGVGSTAIACKNTNRDYILIEKEERYFNLIKEQGL